MITRYPAPAAEAILNDQAKIERWRNVSDIYLNHRINHEFPEDQRENLREALRRAATPTPHLVRSLEREFGHDVVAFLVAYTTVLPEALRPWLHYGLTSSDLVDTGHFEGLRLHACRMKDNVRSLIQQMRVFSDQKSPVWRAGRTHGQIADITSFRHQMQVHVDTLTRIHGQFASLSNMWLMKSPGPTGFSPLWFGKVPEAVAIVDSTQVIPRDYQLQWATAYLRLSTEIESIATFIRCGARQEIGELQERARRVGSSSMPTKTNPIQSERLCGLARVSRGHFLAIAESVALWDDRDISNSSVERTSVVELAATVEYMVSEAHRVMKNLRVDDVKMLDNIRLHPEVQTHYLQAAFQRHLHVGPVKASELVRLAFNPRANLIDARRLVVLGFEEQGIMNAVAMVVDVMNEMGLDAPVPRTIY